MWREFWTSTRARAKHQVLSFGHDAGSVFQALGAWGVIFLLGEIVLGLLPLSIVLTLGATVDAMIGARGIGVVTSDVNDQLIRWLVILLASFLAYLFTVRFTGKAGDVGRGLREIVLFSSLLLYLIGIHQVFLAFVYLAVLVIDVLFVQNVRIRLAGLLLAILSGSAIAHAIIRFTALRSFTVGEGLAMVTGIAMFVVCLKLRVASKV